MNTPLIRDIIDYNEKVLTESHISDNEYEELMNPASLIGGHNPKYHDIHKQAIRSLDKKNPYHARIMQRILAGD